MRIPSGSTDRYVSFVAVDSTDLKTRETGFSSFTVYRARNGGTPVAYTSPTIVELSAANMPGVYALLVDEDTTIGATHDTEEYVVHITHAGMAPVTRALELYRPEIEEGKTLDIGSDSKALISTNEPNIGNLANMDSAISGLNDLSTAQVDAIMAAAIAGLNNLSAAQVNAQVLDVLRVDTVAELASIPAKNAPLHQMIQLCFLWIRNKVITTRSTHTLRNDADDADIGSCSIDDNQTTETFTKDKMS